MAVYRLVKVRLRYEGEKLRYRDYTAKIVKSILIEANPALKPAFEDNKDAVKQIHITPLFAMGRDGREKCLYSRVRGSKVYNVVLSRDTHFYFYIGFNAHLYERDVFKALMSLPVEIPVRERRVAFNIGGYELVRSLDLSNYRNVRKNVQNWTCAKSIKVVFKTPTLIRDPYTAGRRRFLPLAGWLFSINALDLFGGRTARRIIKGLNYLLRESYTALETVRITHYIYEGKPKPALIGYIKYFLDTMRLTPSKAIALEKLPLIMEHAQILGAGTGRAAGFGHIEITLHCES